MVEYLLIYREIEDPQIAETITKTLNRSEEMPNIVEKWMDVGLQKGLEEGRQEGRQEGLQEGRQEAIEKLLIRTHLSPSEIATTLDVNLDWVLEIQKNLRIFHEIAFSVKRGWRSSIFLIKPIRSMSVP